MKILYIGNSEPHTTSYHRAAALARIGHEVIIQDPYQSMANGLGSKYLSSLHFRTGYRFLQHRMRKWVRHIVSCTGAVQLIWVNGGELLGPECVSILKAVGCPVVLYNNDDPTGRRDGRRFDSLLKAFSYYDLCVVRLEKDAGELTKYGAKEVLRVHMSYDEVAHKPFDDYSMIPDKFKSEVAFIGTWMRHEKRDEFMLQLIKAGIPVSIWGNRWQKSPLWIDLQRYYRGGALGGNDYVAAIQGAKICIGMLSHGNRDLHTRRSVETTYAGGLLCAQRTPIHINMYEEGKEAAFWDNAEECVAICKKLLANDQLRESIRKAGNKKAEQLKIGNEDICKSILASVRLMGTANYVDDVVKHER